MMLMPPVRAFSSAFAWAAHAGIDPVTAESGSTDPEAGFPERPERDIGKTVGKLCVPSGWHIQRSSDVILSFCFFKVGHVEI
jgi:hypothetical protein